jgi:hypothetical protein
MPSLTTLSGHYCHLQPLRRTGSSLSFSNFLTDFPPLQIRGSRGFVEKIQIIFFQLIFPPSLAYVAAGGLRKKFKINFFFLSAFPLLLLTWQPGVGGKKIKNNFFF